ncbi:DUF4271 domain-containing protein [Chitinophaga eiseniae]|uniref:DUF4271 domain-containing protein n=1 Tax=Chitinophaga eiseniae TaxID=634771 RepID=A0A847SSL4_9BACT|nr:DUF4271 domain-containing protein [Chitinophaga eiseniae]NLR79222.1 DUF4271 domain-containing protein [Chitinophaga eiseniae]
MRNWLLLLFIFSYLPILAQTTDSAAAKPVVKKKPVVSHTVGDSSRPKPRIAPLKRDSAKVVRVKRDSTRAALPVVAHQKKDSTRLPADTAGHKTDSVAVAAVPKVKPVSDYDRYMKQLAQENIFLKPGKPRFVDTNPLRPYRDMDWLIYLMAGILLVLSVVRLAYRKYFSDLFRAFLNPTLSQRQLKDQLSQSPFPNFLLNIFFAIVLGVYFYLVLYRQQVFPQAQPWLLIPALVLLVAVVYGFKYVMLRFCGWLFGNSELADAYIFILYLINKILGVLLVPFLVIIAFCKPEIARTFLYISLFFMILLVVYRYIRSYSLVKQYLSFSKLHFFLYLCTFEVAPVLILTKVLQNIWLTGNP